MDIFNSIKTALFGGSADAATQADSTGQTPNTDQAAATDTAATNTAATNTAATDTAATPSATSAQQPFDVAALLAQKAEARGEPLNYQTSIVDLLKALDLPSGLSSRKELASELGYTGSTEDTATMNQWLHREVMTKLAADGGVVPDDWKHPG